MDASNQPSGVGVRAVLIQWLYLPPSGGFTTPAMWPEAARTKRVGPWKSCVAL